MTERLGQAALIALAVYAFFFDGFRVVFGTVYTALGG